MVFSPDGNILATSSIYCDGEGTWPGKSQIWRVNDGAILNSYDAPVDSLLFARGGKILVEKGLYETRGPYLGEINVRDVASNKIIRNIKLKDNFARFTGNIALNQSETLLVSAITEKDQKYEDKKYLVAVWDFQTGKLVKQFEGHQGQINFVIFTPTNEIISSSNDKTTRLWSLQDGKKLNTFKENPYLFECCEGRSIGIVAAFDPNYGLLAVLGKDYSVGIRDVQKGQLINTIQTAENKLSGMQQAALAFSPDGKFLAGGSPLKIWALPKGNQIASLGSTESEKRSETSLAFSIDGKVFSLAFENGVSRFWNISNINLEGTFGHPTKKIKEIVVESNEHGFEIPSRKGKGSSWYARKFMESPVFNKEGNLLAARDNKNLDTINVISTLNGKHMKSLEHKVNVPTVLSFNNDGTILASSTERILLPETNAPEIKLWSMPDGIPLRTFNKELSNCLSAIPVGKHLICYYTDNSIKFWRISDGSLEKTISKPIPSKPTDGHLYTNHDGTILFVQSAAETYGNRFIIDLWRLPDGKYLKRIKLSDDDGKIDQASISPDSSIKGKPSLYTFESISISPDSAFMVVSASTEGPNEMLLLFRVTDGKLLKHFIRHSDPVFTSDGKYFVTNNQTVFRLSDGKLIKTLPARGIFSKDGRFMGKLNYSINTDELWMLKDKAGKEVSEKVLSMRCQDDGEYIIYTPDGYYERSPEGTSQIYWTFSNGLFPESFSFEQLESVYRRPDIIKARLAGDLNAGKPAPPATRPPYVEMADHREIKETAETTYPLKLTASALDEVKTLRIFVNGKPAMDIPIGAKEKELSLDVPLSPGMNRITAIAYNQQGFSSNSKYLDVLCKRADLPKPNLYVIGIGVSEYAMLPKEWQLSSAHKDAKSVISAFKSQEGKIFGRVEAKLLTNAEASVEAITDALKSLESVKENDLAVVFLAGHGIMSKDEVFYFLSSSGELEKPENGGISWQLLGDALNKVKGRVLVLLDACHSGNISTQVIVPNDELAQKLRSEGKSGIMVFSASKGRQSALEDVDGGYGVFAHAITQSLGPESKQADTNGNGFVEFMELVDHVRKNVDKETEGDQTPWLSRKELFGDFAIASVLK